MRKPLAYLIGLLLLVFHACKPTPPEPYLRVNPSSLSFTEDGGSQTVQLSANYPWSARVSGTGLSVSPSSGSWKVPKMIVSSMGLQTGKS